MNEQTLGRRIAAERKKLGLSQEALGEKMGVSRQAISKWEADATVPEIDKLIAMSKLFGVSLGWLLGVEEAQPQQSPALTEEQLQMIEQIVQKYQQKPQPSRLVTALAAGALVLSLVLSALALVKAGDDGAVSSMQGQLAHLTTNYSNLQGDLAYLSNQLAELTAGAKLLMEYDFYATALEDLSGAAVTFTAMPNSRQDGDTGVLSVHRGGREVIRADCAWDGVTYTATVPVPTADDYEYYFIQSHAAGGQEQQRLEPEYYFVTNIASGMEFDHLVVFDTVNENTATMSLLGYHAFLYIPPLARQTGIAWEQADLVIVHNGTEIHRTSVLTAQEYTLATREPTEHLAVPEDTSGHGEVEIDLEKRCVLLDVKPRLQSGDTLEARLELALSNGMTAEATVESWTIH